MPSSPSQNSSDSIIEILAKGTVRFFSSIFLYFFGFLEPHWKKEARAVIKGATRYINYRKDVMRPDKREEFQSRLDSLKAAFAKKDKELTLSKAALVEQYADTLPYNRRDSLSENTEAFFVIIAIFFGINAYIAQPFRIPTGSMQPSLNGIRAFDLGDAEKPALPLRLLNMVRYGSTYEHIVADSRKTITDYQDNNFLLFTRAVIHFDDGSSIKLPGSKMEIARLIETRGKGLHPTFQKGETIVNARFDAGDIVLVNKMAYHFRKPVRGEVFVFDTKGIEGVAKRSNHSEAGAHYIKRLVGLPGDSLQINSPNLLVNGKPAAEKTIQRVQKGKPPYNPEGYVLAEPENTLFLQRYLYDKNSVLKLARHPENPHLNEYAAMGDNTTNSLDSRYWGSLKQYNVIGPALFNFWPFTEHWGLIP